MLRTPKKIYYVLTLLKVIFDIKIKVPWEIALFDHPINPSLLTLPGMLSYSLGWETLPKILHKECFVDHLARGEPYGYR